ncbi:MAG: ester cyclase [Gammaproteobacteria bacterium]|nr:ester cyclase [Gammaproteobacteria bacterium]
MSESVAAAKTLFKRFRTMLYDCDASLLREQLASLCGAGCAARLAHPIGDLQGPGSLFEQGYAPLLTAIPDLERRDYVVVGGLQDDETWIGSGGYYTGVFERPWLDIPPTGHLVTMRYIEFFRIEGNQIVEMKLLWDIPALMMQAGAWPMAPSLGVDMHVPGPATQDGIVDGADDAQTAESFALVQAMVDGLSRFAEGGADAMQLDKYWHPKMNWYGPAGIGSNRRISGFRQWHQIPFLKAMPNRTGGKDNSWDCYFADGDYVVFCGWPAMKATVTGDGWMGISPAGQELLFSSLDIWRCENGMLRENWVLIDLLDVWNQLGVDVLERMREKTGATK